MKRLSPQDANRELTASVLTTGEPGPSAQQLLYRLHLSEQFHQYPVETIATLHAGLGQRDEPARLYALAELSFDYAERSGDRSYDLAAAAYAWVFLFPPNPEASPGCNDPRRRAAMDLYNRAIATGLGAGKGNTVDLSARVVSLPYGPLRMDVDGSSFAYGGSHLDNFISMDGFAVRGMRNRYRVRGIGAPLAAQVAKSGRVEVDRWNRAPNAKVPVTALLRFDDPRLGMSSGKLHATIELYDVEDRAAVQIDGTTVPLESDSSAVLAYRLEGAPIWDFDIAGFRGGDLLLGDKVNLIMLHPYHPGRIPVVFVHGTASNPARWAEMTNELLNDPVIGKRYQFWYFIYNTGNPIGFSAMRLREALQGAVKDVDPNGTDPALRQMVVIGHSQGGLLTKMTVVSSGTKFWDNISSVPFEQAELDPETRDLLRRAMFVEPLPFVTEVIFISTPHRGSYLADNPLSNLARKLISLPGNITRIGVQMATLQGKGALKTAFTMPTSLDNMKGSNPGLKTLQSLPIAPGVRAHSIVAVKGDGPPAEGDDGVVKYTSAHIDGVDSELIVRWDHSCQATPEAIEEVRRILYQHLDQP